MEIENIEILFSDYKFNYGIGMTRETIKGKSKIKKLKVIRTQIASDQLIIIFENKVEKMVNLNNAISYELINSYRGER